MLFYLKWSHRNVAQGGQTILKIQGTFNSRKKLYIKKESYLHGFQGRFKEKKEERKKERKDPRDMFNLGIVMVLTFYNNSFPTSQFENIIFPSVSYNFSIELPSLKF